jgi:hypothetical protein
MLLGLLSTRMQPRSTSVLSPLARHKCAMEVPARYRPRNYRATAYLSYRPDQHLVTHRQQECRVHPYLKDNACWEVNCNTRWCVITADQLAAAAGIPFDSRVTFDDSVTVTDLPCASYRAKIAGSTTLKESLRGEASAGRRFSHEQRYILFVL